MAEKFIGSPEPTVGVEIELQLVDRKSRDLISICPEILSRMDGAGWVKSELLQSTVEINSRVCKNVLEVRDDLGAKLDRLRQVADECGVALASAGTHPFAKWEDQEITQTDSYWRLVHRV